MKLILFSVEFKNTRNYASAATYTFMACIRTFLHYTRYVQE